MRLLPVFVLVSVGAFTANKFDDPVEDATTTAAVTTTAAPTTTAPATTTGSVSTY